MRARTILSTAIILLLTIDVSGQTSITSEYNGYRDGDKLYRIVADETSLGDRGENCIWQLPPVENSDKVFRQMIYLRNDSLTIVEGDYLLHYMATDKELSMRGYQMRDMYSVHDRVLPELKYPFVYGDSIADTFSCRTTYYDNFSVDGEGVCYTVCDGKGVLTDGNETLTDVLRIHHRNTTVSRYHNEESEDADSILSEVIEDKYLWYYSGCRYPIMDTRVITWKENGETVSDTTFTSLYMPELQASELAYDDANSRLIAEREANENSSGQGVNDNQTPFPITMSASLLPGHGEISLNYTIAENTDAAFYAYDLAGRLLGCVTHLSLSEGEYHETMVLDKRPINNIVMLTIVAGDRQIVVKVS